MTKFKVMAILTAVLLGIFLTSNSQATPNVQGPVMGSEPTTGEMEDPNENVPFTLGSTEYVNQRAFVESGRRCGSYLNPIKMEAAEKIFKSS
jgi:hypothetical protein